MPDITMCSGDDCPLRNRCYRYRATPTPKWQSYFDKAQYDHKKMECDSFWEDEE